MIDTERFEHSHIDCLGRYTGRDLHDYGFPFEPDEYVPPQDRAWAAKEYSHAIHIKHQFAHAHGLVTA